MKKKIFVTQSIPEAGLSRLAQEDGFEVVYNNLDVPLSKEEFIERAKGCHGILSLLSDKIDSQVIQALDSCKVIANYAVGYDNIDVEAAQRKNIWVTNTPDILTPATADIAFALMLAVSRRIVEGHHFCCDRKFTGWKAKLLLGADLNGATLGIIGMGRIGQAFARRALPFGMKIIYHNRNRLSNDIERSLNATWLPLDDLVTSSDFISLHCPGGDGTRHIIGSRELSMMKSGAIIVNTARGSAIDEGALAQALSEKSIRGAGLDVFEHEPVINEALFGLDNVVLAPHLGSATEDTRDNMAVMAAENIISALRGERPPQCVFS